MWKFFWSLPTGRDPRRLPRKLFAQQKRKGAAKPGGRGRGIPTAELPPRTTGIPRHPPAPGHGNTTTPPQDRRNTKTPPPPKDRGNTRTHWERLRKAAVFCGFLRPADAGVFRKMGESAKICGFLRKSAFWVLSVTLIPSPQETTDFRRKLQESADWALSP